MESDWAVFLTVLANDSKEARNTLHTTVSFERGVATEATEKPKLGEPDRELWDKIGLDVVRVFGQTLDLELSIKLLQKEEPKFEFFWRRSREEYGWFVNTLFWGGVEQLLVQTTKRRRRKRNK